MTLTNLLVRTVDIVTPGTRTDAYGDPQPDWTTATTTTTAGWLAQQSSLEDRDGRDGTASTLALTVPAGTVITNSDRVVIDGRTYEVVAEPLAAWTPHGEHHIECLLSRVAG